ncbi:TPA: hypothetical protein EYP26_06270 [Candidatus Bathyarchaeota archaeon]|nr:hypothetical protein [Candidatus Bathyarchaeota archaeon]
MPFGKWKDFNACVRDFMNEGYSEDEAKRICGKLQAELGGEKGPEFRWVEVFEKTQLKPQLKIRGIAIKAGISRNQNIWLEEELKAAASSLIGQPIYLEHVDVANAVGKVTNAWWDPERKAILYEGEIYDDEVANKIRAGLIQHVSIGADYEILEPVNGQIPRGLRFRELSLVAAPGIPETNIQVLEKLFERMGKMGEKGGKTGERVVRHARSYVKAPEDTDWSFTAEDGDELLDRGGWNLYREAHAWYDPERADVKAGYKLPHHKIVNGKFAVVWRGIAGAMAALMGARGGVDIPAADRRAVYNHLAAHYREYDREPPAYETARLEFALEELQCQVEALTHQVNELREHLKPKPKRIVVRL